MKKFLVLVFLLGFIASSFPRETSLELKVERFDVKLEEGFKAVNQRMDDMNKRIDDINRRIDDTNKRIDDLQTIMLWGFGVLFSGMGILIGLVIWDRRTAISPVVKKAKDLNLKIAL